jgi:hypothetical protein
MSDLQGRQYCWCWCCTDTPAAADTLHTAQCACKRTAGNRQAGQHMSWRCLQEQWSVCRHVSRSSVSMRACAGAGSTGQAGQHSLVQYFTGQYRTADMTLECVQTFWVQISSRGGSSSKALLLVCIVSSWPLRASSAPRPAVTVARIARQPQKQQQQQQQQQIAVNSSRVPSTAAATAADTTRHVCQNTHNRRLRPACFLSCKGCCIAF